MKGRCRALRRRTWASSCADRVGRRPCAGLPVCLEHGGGAAVEIDAGAGDVARRGRGQKRDHVRDLLGVADAAERNVLGHFRVQRFHVDAALRGAPLVLAGAHQADADGVDQDALRRVLLGQRLGQRETCGARHGGGHRARARLLGADVGDVDDATAAGPLHVRDGEPRQAHGGEQLEIEIGLPGGVVHGLEFACRRSAGVVDQNVDAAEAAQGLVDCARAVLGAADVGANGQGGAAGCADLFGHLRQPRFAARHDRHASALRRKAQRARPADALAAARDEGNAVLQSEIHVGRSPPRRSGIRGKSILASRCRRRPLFRARRASAAGRRAR